MRTESPNIDHTRLKRLIDSYFEGTTSLAEEKLLRRLLAESDDRSEAAEEARAVLGVFAVSRRLPSAAPVSTSRRKRRLPLRAVASVAASLAVIIIGTVALVKMPGRDISSTASLTTPHEMKSTGSDTTHLLAYSQGIPHGGISLAVASASTLPRDLTSDDDIDNIIGREMGYMAEAERTVYESIADDFNSFAGVMQ